MTILGTNQSNLTKLSAADLDAVCTSIAAFGFTHVRFSVNWGAMTNWWGPIDYTPVYRVATALAKHNLTPLPVLGCNKPWFSDASLGTWGTFVQNVVNIFGTIPTYEVWNEPNIWNFGVGTPATYLGFLRTAAPIIRAKGSKVMHAGLAAYVDRPFFMFTNYSPVTWLTQLYAAGEKNDYDIFAYHPYSLDASGNWADPATNPFGLAQVQALQTLRAQHGDWRPIAFTEVGWDTNRTPAAQAAAYLPAQMAELRNNANLDSIYAFCFQDDTADDGGAYGILSAPNTPKAPYYAAVQGLLK
jgi:hypothetical protein